MNNRTQIPDGEKIAALRTAKGWSQEDLMRRINEIACKTHSNAVPNAVVLTSRTIARVEAGQPAYLRTLRSIAVALEVDVGAITKQKHTRRQLHLGLLNLRSIKQKMQRGRFLSLNLLLIYFLKY